MGGRNKSLTSTSLIGGMIILIDDANLKTGFLVFSLDLFTKQLWQPNLGQKEQRHNLPTQNTA